MRPPARTAWPLPVSQLLVQLLVPGGTAVLVTVNPDDVVVAPTNGGPNRKRQVVIAVLTMAAIGVVFVGILPQFADYREALAAVRDLPAEWIAALVVATAVSLFVYALQWPATLPELRFRRAFALAETSFFVSNGIPGGGAVVLPIQYAMLGDEGIDASRASAATAVTALWNILATLLVPLVGVCFLVGSGDNTPTWWLTIVGGFAGFAIVALGLRALVQSEDVARRVGQNAERLVNRVLRAFKRDRPMGWGDAVAAFQTSTHRMLSTRWLQISFAHIGIQLTQFSVLAIALAGLQRNDETTTSFAVALFAFGVSRLGTFIPITPGGLGTVDGVLAALLVSAGGAAASDALAAVLIWRTLTLLPGLVLGLISFVVWRRTSATRVSAEFNESS